MWRYQFASLYATRFRIPLYSAYVLYGCGGDCFAQELVTAVRDNTTWFIEPQLSNFSSEEMVMPGDQVDVFGQNQAVLSDYEGNICYIPGQLNPYNYHSTYSALSTFTLTNAVPFHPEFQQAWQRAQESLKDLVGHMSGTAYFVTGAVADVNSTTISHGRVSVPSHVWTAMCYKRRRTGWSTSSFSLGLIGQNGGSNDAINGGIQVMSLSELTMTLKQLYRTKDLRIFYRDCPCSRRRSRLMKHKLQLRLNVHS
ncbi:endonuclease domain-containing 1 protein-like [Polymixia lowei]